MMMRTWIRFAAIGAVISLAACSSEITKSASPIELVATNTQVLNRIDILSGAQGCNQTIGTIELQAIIKNPAAGNTTFEQVKLTSYTVSYTRRRHEPEQLSDPDSGSVAGGSVRRAPASERRARSGHAFFHDPHERHSDRVRSDPGRRQRRGQHDVPTRFLLQLQRLRVGGGG
jgi:hypothetical protein